MSDIVNVEINEVFVPDGRRPVDNCKVLALSESLEKLGLLQPILVREEGGRIRLVAGAHRLAAAQLLDWTQIAAVFIGGDDVRARLAEISENLHRNELSALERDELIAEWIRLIETAHDVQSSQSETIETKRADGRGHRKEGGVNAAARKLGISKADAHRAVKVAALAPEAKDAAREGGVDDNRSALLTAAEQSKPERQIEAIRERARPTKPSDARSIDANSWLPTSPTSSLRFLACSGTAYQKRKAASGARSCRRARALLSLKPKTASSAIASRCWKPPIELKRDIAVDSNLITAATRM